MMYLCKFDQKLAIGPEDRSFFIELYDPQVTLNLGQGNKNLII